jgi:hypothetical protein
MVQAPEQPHYCALLEASDCWSAVIYDMCKTGALSALDMFASYVLRPKMPSNQRCIVLMIFSSVLVVEDSLMAQKLLGGTYILMKDDPPASDLIELTSGAIINVLVQCLQRYSETMPMDLPKAIVTRLVDVDTVESFATRAYLSNFIDVKDMHTLDEYLKFGASTRDELMPGFLRGLVFKLCGRNDVTEIERKTSHTDYAWTLENPKFVQDRVVQFLRTRCAKQAFGLTKLSWVIEMLLVMTLPSFVKKLLIFGRTVEAQSLFQAFHRFFTNLDIYNRYHPDDATSIDVLKDSAADLAVFSLSRMFSDTTHSTFHFRTTSFTADLYAALEPRPIALQHLVRNISTNSRVVYDDLERPIDILQRIRKWIDHLGDRSMENVFASVTLEERVPDDRIKYRENPTLDAILAMSLYLDPTDDFLQLLCQAVLSPVPTSSAIANRVLQAHVHLDPKRAEPILRELCICFQSKAVNQVSVTIIVSSIVLVLDAANSESALLTDSAVASIC